MQFTHVQYTAVAVDNIAYFSFFARNLTHLYEEIDTYGQTPHAVVYADSMCEELRYDEINDDPSRGQDLERSVSGFHLGRGGGGGKGTASPLTPPKAKHIPFRHFDKEMILCE